MGHWGLLGGILTIAIYNRKERERGKGGRRGREEEEKEGE